MYNLKNIKQIHRNSYLTAQTQILTNLNCFILSVAHSDRMPFQPLGPGSGKVFISGFRIHQFLPRDQTIFLEIKIIKYSVADPDPPGSETFV